MTSKAVSRRPAAQIIGKDARGRWHRAWCVIGYRRWMMRAFLATVLSVIAIGVVAIAYGLLSPRAASAQGGIVTLDPRDGSYQLARPIAYAPARATPDDPSARAPMRYAMTESRDVRDPRAIAAPRPYYASAQAPVAPGAARRVA